MRIVYCKSRIMYFIKTFHSCRCLPSSQEHNDPVTYFQGLQKTEMYLVTWRVQTNQNMRPMRWLLIFNDHISATLIPYKQRTRLVVTTSTVRLPTGQPAILTFSQQKLNNKPFLSSLHIISLVPFVPLSPFFPFLLRSQSRYVFIPPPAVISRVKYKVIITFIIIATPGQKIQVQIPVKVKFSLQRAIRQIKGRGIVLLFL